MESKLDWEFIKTQLPPEWRELAIERGLIRPQLPQLHAKITDIEQVLRLLLHRVSNNTSLQMTTATAAMAKQAITLAHGEQAADEVPLVELSAPALHYWERKLAPYLAELLARMLATDSMFPPAQWSGYDVVLADGTTVTHPGAKGTTARVLYALRLCDLTVISCQATDEHGSEAFRVFDPQPGQLWIADRLYSNPFDIAWVHDAGAVALVRYNFGALPLYDRFERPFDVLDHVRLFRTPGETAQWPVQVLLDKHTPIQGRLCALRLSDAQAHKARERLRREQGADVSAEALQAAAWMIVFTTIPDDRLTTDQVLELYRLRWQVELEIKRDKSLGGLDQLPNFRTDTIATWLYAKLLLQQIARKIVSPTVAFPPCAGRDALVPGVPAKPTAVARGAAGAARHDERSRARVQPTAVVRGAAGAARSDGQSRARIQPTAVVRSTARTARGDEQSRARVQPTAVVRGATRTARGDERSRARVQPTAIV